MLLTAWAWSEGSGGKSCTERRAGGLTGTCHLSVSFGREVRRLVSFPPFLPFQADGYGYCTGWDEL